MVGSYCDIETSSNSSETIKLSEKTKGKESLKQFLARSKGNNSNKMSFKVEYILKDDYEKADSCESLIRKHTGIIYDNKMTLHECPWDRNYPEKPDRYRVVLRRCRELGLIDRCLKLMYSPADADDILKLHTKQLYDKLQLISMKTNLQNVERDASNYDSVYFNKETFKSAMLSAGCAISLVKGICTGIVQNGMAIIRPPGHHAMNNEFCGYCYFNNVAIAAQYALDNSLAKRILIVDYDAHHGQGTQRLFYEENRVLYFSIHRYEHGTFWPNLRESNYDYIGEKDGKGFNINFPLNVTGLEDSDFLAIVEHILLPVAYEFQPELIVISAGFDSAIGDEKGKMNVSPGFYGHIITLLSGLASGRLAVCLEGGYFLPSLGEGVAMTLKSLLGDPTATLKPLVAPHPTVIETINNLKIVLHDYWNCFRVYAMTTDESDGTLHKAVVKYLGKPDIRPFPTRNCYPSQNSEHIEKYTKIIALLQDEYNKLGTNQSVCYCYDENMLLHDSNKDFHVETPKRLSDTFKQFQEWGLDSRCIKLKPKVMDTTLIKKVHKNDYLDNILKENFELLAKDSRDLFFNKSTLTAVLKAVACLVAVVDSVMKNESQSGVALIRPPGHHADSDTPSGFCYINNIAVATQYLLDSYNVKRILIMDFDIHHGNGTQNIFYKNNRVLYISIHKYEDAKFYPFTTDSDNYHCGDGEGLGYNVNIAMNKARLSNVDYITIFHNIVLPIAYSYVPEIILVSAGFDAGINDKLGNYYLTPDCFGHFIQLLKPLANGKIILALEGGYNPMTVKYSMNICIKTLLGDPLPLLELNPNTPNEQCMKTISNVIQIQKKYWPAIDVHRNLVANIYKEEQDKLPKGGCATH